MGWKPMPRENGKARHSLLCAAPGCSTVSSPSAEVEVGGVKKKVGSIPHAFNRPEHHDKLFALDETVEKPAMNHPGMFLAMKPAVGICTV